MTLKEYLDVTFYDGLWTIYQKDTNYNCYKSYEKVVENHVDNKKDREILYSLCGQYLNKEVLRVNVFPYSIVICVKQ